MLLNVNAVFVIRSNRIGMNRIESFSQFSISLSWFSSLSKWSAMFLHASHAQWVSKLCYYFLCFHPYTETTRHLIWLYSCTVEVKSNWAYRFISVREFFYSDTRLPVIFEYVNVVTQRLLREQSSDIFATTLILNGRKSNGRRRCTIENR